MKTIITYFVSKSTDEGFSWVITAQRNNGNREIYSRYRSEKDLNEAIGLATKMAITSKHDFGNDARLVIEADICSIADPMIKI